MENMSLTGDRAYLLGGDYFLELLRSVMVVPFNMDLMDANASIFHHCRHQCNHLQPRHYH